MQEQRYKYPVSSYHGDDNDNEGTAAGEPLLSEAEAGKER